MSIELPVDIGENALKYSTPDRLQESFVTIIEYLMTSEHTPQQWIQFLSLQNYETLTLLAQSAQRLLELEMEELDESTTKQEDDNNEAETEETEDDYTHASALSLLCQILVMFGSLDASKFCPIITEHAYHSILASIKYHRNIKRFDTVNRLKLIEFIAIYHKKINIETMYVETLCEMLESDYTDVIETASSSLIYTVARARKSSIHSLLQLIEEKLSSDALRHFTQFYFKLLNSLDYNECIDDSLELLITFNSNVFKWNLDSFYFTSDIKVLIDIYIRSFHNTSPSSKALLLCLDGVYNIIRWKQYSNKDTMDQYKSDQLTLELQELTKTVQTAANDFNSEHKQNDEESYSQEEVDQVLKLIEKIQNKMDVILETLSAIKKGEYDYDAVLDEAIQLPLDISQYALDTKGMAVLQRELMELLQFLSESTNTPSEWIEFLSDNEYEVFHRLCGLSKRLRDKESGNENEENEEDRLDDELLYPLSALCQLLATFSSLNPSEFVVILKANMLETIMKSLEVNHKALSSDDVAVRLQTVLFMMTSMDGVFESENEWFYKVLVTLLESEYEPVLSQSTKCIAYYIGKLSDRNREKQKQCLLYLQEALKGDDFRHFTEHYCVLFNDAEWDESDAQTELLVRFMQSVMKNELNDFFYSSDLKVMIDVLERTLHNINADGLAMQWCIDGVHTLFQWNAYKTELNKYHYDELCQEIKSQINNAIDHQLFEIAGALDSLLRIAM